MVRLPGYITQNHCMGWLPDGKSLTAARAKVTGWAALSKLQGAGRVTIEATQSLPLRQMCQHDKMDRSHYTSQHTLWLMVSRELLARAGWLAACLPKEAGYYMYVVGKLDMNKIKVGGLKRTWTFLPH